MRLQKVVTKLLSDRVGRKLDQHGTVWPPPGPASLGGAVLAALQSPRAGEED